jgi:hypothetical protein
MATMESREVRFNTVFNNPTLSDSIVVFFSKGSGQKGGKPSLAVAVSLYQVQLEICSDSQGKRSLLSLD